MNIDSTFSLQIRKDFVKGGRERISKANYKIFDSQFDSLDFSDYKSSFSEVIFPAILEYMASVYKTAEKQSVLWTNPMGKSHIFFRENKLNATVKKRGQERWGTKNIVQFNPFIKDVDLHWQDILEEIGANLFPLLIF